MSEEKKEWEEREIEAMAKIAGRTPMLLPALDKQTEGRVSAYIEKKRNEAANQQEDKT